MIKQRGKGRRMTDIEDVKISVPQIGKLLAWLIGGLLTILSVGGGGIYYLADRLAKMDSKIDANDKRQWAEFQRIEEHLHMQPADPPHSFNDGGDLDISRKSNPPKPQIALE